MATNTYVALDKVTVGTATPSITFSSISSAYTDLVLVITGATDRSGVAIDDIGIRFNSDASSTYCYAQFYGDGSSTGSDQAASQTFIKCASWFPGGIGGSGYRGFAKIEIMNYSNSTAYKSIVSRYSDLATSSQGLVGGSVGTWSNTAAITSVTIVSTTSSNFQSGFTASLYGIAAEAISPAPKATGGAIYSDSTYYYHVFGSTGTFTPLQSLATEMLVVGAGGGASGGTNGVNYGSAGGSGIVSYSSQTMSNATAYTCTVGAGGAGSTGNGSNGASSSIAGTGITTVTATAGNGATTGRTGGSNASFSGGTGATGFNGGGGAGSAANGSDPNGGAGTGSYSAWLTATGTGVSGYIAGGGGGGSTGIGGAGGGGNGGTAGTNTPGNTNTGSGGGGGTSAVAGGNGGSGLVIVRYAK